MMTQGIKKPRKHGAVVFTNGVFDLLHEGHIAILKFSKSLGDRLVVGLNSDKSTRMLKGPTRPIHNERRRKAALEELGFVDEVIIFDELRTTQVVQKVKPHIIVKGAEYSEQKVRDDDKIPEDIKIVLCPILANETGEKISTTARIAKTRRN